MNVLLSPELNLKFASIPKASLARISAFVSACESLTREQVLDNTEFEIQLLGENVYAVKLDSGRLYLVFGNNDKGDYLLLLDFAAITTAPALKNNFFSSNNPKTNSALNPSVNSHINPNYNSHINPKFNSYINPKFNSHINPKFNSHINPKFNSHINPKFNSHINPKYNSSINPRYNASLNPRFNRSYGGPYFYNLKLDQVDYIVRANETVDLVFSFENEFKGILVHADESVRICFNEEMEPTGYLVKANEQVSLWYTNDAEWLGMLI